MASLKVMLVIRLIDKLQSPKPHLSNAIRACGSGCHRSLQLIGDKPRDHAIQPIVHRRSGNYNPTFWDFDYIQSLNNEYHHGDKYMRRATELKGRLKVMLEPIESLELIDDLQRLGISYHFEDEIKQILYRLYHQKYNKNVGDHDKPKDVADLYSTALEFRILRQHGFQVPQEVFSHFINKKGDFKGSLVEDTKGLFQLYEASHLLREGEHILEQAREFATITLLEKLEMNQFDDENLSRLVSNSLDLPLHWRVQRLNARWFIEEYDSRSEKNTVVLELAKLDFNIVQAALQEELKHISRWWKSTSIVEKLPFARDRLVECFLFSIGVCGSHSQDRHSRSVVAMANQLVTVIDDVFDVYGTMEELRLFYDIIQRWDMEGVDQLPAYMQVCFLTLNNFIEETAHSVPKEQGRLIVPHLRKSWGELCKAYLKEAEWYSEKYTPKLEEYMENAWVSISACVALSHAFWLSTNNPLREEESIHSSYKYHNVVRWSGILIRLANDLGTSPEEMKRGDVAKSIECYMYETGATREEAQEHIMHLIRDTWKKMNAELAGAVDSPFQLKLITRAAGLGRVAQQVYLRGDGFGNVNAYGKNIVSGLLFEPIILHGLQ